jgi:Na+-translocating ferredoxin:NAD+ oxidoreductase RnfD subunit
MKAIAIAIAIAIAMAAMIGLFFVLTEPVQARAGDVTYCKSGAPVKHQKACKENGGKW